MKLIHLSKYWELAYDCFHCKREALLCKQSLVLVFIALHLKIRIN